MLVTITCDASYDNYSSSAGYGFLISSNAGRFSKGGKLETAENITEAELMAIANALHYVYNHKELWGVTKIILNVDFIAAKEMIFKHGGTKMTRKKKKYRVIRSKITNYIGLFRKEYSKFKLEFRHVKAHSNVRDTRSRANEYVDKLAVKARKNEK